MKKKFTKERFYKKLRKQEIKKKCNILQKGIDIAKMIVANQTEITKAIQQREITLGEVVVSTLRGYEDIKEYLRSNT